MALVRRKKRFANVVFADDGTASRIKDRVRPKSLADVRSLVEDIRDGREAYFLVYGGDGRHGPQCRALRDHIAVFFNEGPNGVLELFDAEYQP
jgi:hypothetical protein